MAYLTTTQKITGARSVRRLKKKRRSNCAQMREDHDYQSNEDRSSESVLGLQTQYGIKGARAIQPDSSRNLRPLICLVEQEGSKKIMDVIFSGEERPEHGIRQLCKWTNRFLGFSLGRSDSGEQAGESGVIDLTLY